MIPTARLALFAAISMLAAPSLAQPVPNPNGQVSGFFGDTTFDLPALCYRDLALIVRSHDGQDAPGIEIAFLSGRSVAIEVRTKAGTQQFGVLEERREFPVLIEDDLDGTPFSFEISCPDGV